MEEIIFDILWILFLRKVKCVSNLLFVQLIENSVNDRASQTRVMQLHYDGLLGNLRLMPKWIYLCLLNEMMTV